MRKFFLFIICFCCAAAGFAQFPSAPEVDTSYKPKEHKPGSGMLVYKGKDASLTFSAYTTFRYLNNRGLESTYRDSFGRTKNIQPRNDAQLQKVMLYFSGFMMDPKFRYMLYAWSANTSQGLPAQVVVAGNLQYKINRYADVGIGVGALPGTRSLYGQWPLWLRQDARPMGEEFFRPSFTTGIYVSGAVADNVFYKAMLGNNLSQLGIDAGQMDDQFNSVAVSVWCQSSGYGRNASYGDFENHTRPAYMVGSSFTSSTETEQSQPGSEDPENSQIRLSDGTNIFGINSFNDSSQLKEARYQMASANVGFKYRGFSLDLEMYSRFIDNMVWKDNRQPVNSLLDLGGSLQTSYMLIKERLQVYGIASMIAGEYGDPYELIGGLNFFPYKNRSLRLNSEVIFVENSPVGYTSYPTVVGANGTVFMLNLELYY